MLLPSVVWWDRFVWGKQPDRNCGFWVRLLCVVSELWRMSQGLWNVLFKQVDAKWQDLFLGGFCRSKNFTIWRHSLTATFLRTWRPQTFSWWIIWCLKWVSVAIAAPLNCKSEMMEEVGKISNVFCSEVCRTTLSQHCNTPNVKAVYWNRRSSKGQV